MSSGRDAQLNVSPEVVAAALQYADTTGCAMACPGTIQGEPGWYFDYHGKQVKYESTIDPADPAQTAWHIGESCHHFTCYLTHWSTGLHLGLTELLT